VQDPNRTLSEYELDDLIDYLESECTSPERHTLTKTSSISTEEASSPLDPHPLSDIQESSSSPKMRRAGHSQQLPGSPTPRPRSQKSSMSRSRSCDHLEQDAVKSNEKKVSDSHRKTTLLPGSGLEDDITAKVVHLTRSSFIETSELDQGRICMHIV